MFLPSAFPLRLSIDLADTLITELENHGPESDRLVAPVSGPATEDIIPLDGMAAMPLLQKAL